MNPFIFLIIGATILEAVADILFKFWTINGQNLLLLIGVAIYTASTLVWAYSLRFEILSKAITVFTVLNLVFVIIAGFILFGDQLSLYSKIGIGLGIISVVLMLVS